MKIILHIIYLLLPLVVLGQLPKGNPIKGSIIKRYSHPEFNLAHPLPSPDGSFISASTPNYKGLFLFTPEEGKINILSEEVYSGYFRAFSTPDNTLTFLTRSQSGFVLNSLSLSDPLTLTKSVTFKDTRKFMVSKSGAVVYQNSDGTFSTLRDDKIHPSLGEEIVCYHSDDQVFVRTGDSIVRQDKQSNGTIITSVPSTDFTKVIFQESGQRLYLWDITGNTVRYIGQGEHPSWNRSSTNIVIMVPKDDGHRIMSSNIHIISLNDSAIHKIILNEDGIYMNPSFMPDEKQLVAEDRSTGEIILIRLEE